MSKMTSAIELQTISRILTSKNPAEIEELCGFNGSYYSIYKPHIEFILDHKEEHGSVPDTFTFLARFPDIDIVDVREPLSYIKSEMVSNRKRIMLMETFNGVKDMTSDDPDDAWKYLRNQCEKAEDLTETDPLDIVHHANDRAKQVQEFSKQQRIPTGFDEIDKLMYGGLSTVEELSLWFGRTNTGKSWVVAQMMESAQKHGFPCLCYSPEMQASFLGTRFDTWRANFKNSQLFQGIYDDNYLAYLNKLESEETPAYILEDKDAPDGEVTVPYLATLVKKLGIKLLIIDGLSYMVDAYGKRGDSDHIKYKNLCAGLFSKISKRYGCAVAVFMQANRESRDSKDDKGEIFPNIYNIEGSDHPARISTSAFAIRQLFEKHILDVRMEKGRSMNNQKQVFSYLWDVNSGDKRYVESAESAPVGNVTPVISPDIAGGAPVYTEETAETPAEDIIDEDLVF